MSERGPIDMGAFRQRREVVPIADYVLPTEPDEAAGQQWVQDMRLRENELPAEFKADIQQKKAEEHQALLDQQTAAAARLITGVPGVEPVEATPTPPPPIEDDRRVPVPMPPNPYKVPGYPGNTPPQP
jgi:hypothetical protein